MGRLDVLPPVVDMVGPNVAFISGVMFESHGDHVVISLFLNSKIQGVHTREIVSKDAMAMGDFLRSVQEAGLFIEQNAGAFAKFGVTLN